MRRAALQAARPNAASLIADRIVDHSALAVLVTHYSLRTMWTIRRYQPSDRSAVRQLAGDTAHFGDPIERFFDAREMFLDAFATYYTDVAYHYLWVAHEDGALLGYIMGCPDTHDYNVWFRTERQARGVARGHPALSWRVHAQVAGLHLALRAAARARTSISRPTRRICTSTRAPTGAAAASAPP